IERHFLARIEERDLAAVVQRGLQSRRVNPFYDGSHAMQTAGIGSPSSFLPPPRPLRVHPSSGRRGYVLPPSAFVPHFLRTAAPSEAPASTVITCPVTASAPSISQTTAAAISSGLTRRF